MRTIISALILSCFSLARAEEGDLNATPSDSTLESPEKPSVSSPARSKGRRLRGGGEKDEGSEARDRFEANTVIKSRYRYNGEPLEVDPD